MLSNHYPNGRMKWLAHEEWREPFAEALELHFGPARLGKTSDEHDETGTASYSLVENAQDGLTSIDRIRTISEHRLRLKRPERRAKNAR